MNAGRLHTAIALAFKSAALCTSCFGHRNGHFARADFPLGAKGEALLASESTRFSTAAVYWHAANSTNGEEAVPGEPVPGSIAGKVLHAFQVLRPGTERRDKGGHLV